MEKTKSYASKSHEIIRDRNTMFKIIENRI